MADTNKDLQCKIFSKVLFDYENLEEGYRECLKRCTAEFEKEINDWLNSPQAANFVIRELQPTFSGKDTIILFVWYETAS